MASTGSVTSAFADLMPEVASTRRMLASFPDAQASWKPHDKSRTLAHLASHVATLTALGVSVLTTDSLDVMSRRPGAPQSTAADLLAELDKNASAVQAALAAATPASLEQTWALKQGDTVIVSGTRAAMLRTMVLSHLIHHRAQLGVYYRLLNVPLPGMYGPTADDMPPK